MWKLMQRFRSKPMPRQNNDFEHITDEDSYYCYHPFLKREPDAEGWNYWRDLTKDRHLTLPALTTLFMNCQEFLDTQFKAIYPRVIVRPDEIQLVDLGRFKICFRSNDFLGMFIA